MGNNDGQVEAPLSDKELLRYRSGLPVVKFTKDMLQVPRFADDGHDTYPPEIFQGRDNVLIHTHRVVQIAYNHRAQFMQAGLSVPDILLMLWVHDVPEIITGDVGKLAQISQPSPEDEAAAAQEIFTDNEELLSRFKDFKDAELFFEENQAHMIPRPESIIAKAIDLYEGNHTFFRIIEEYLSDVDQPLDVTNLIIKGYNYMQQKLEQYTNSMKVLPDEEPYVYATQFVRNLLTEHITQVQQVWSGYIKTEEESN